jgi:quinoprotein glucose dehydrogenase
MNKFIFFISLLCLSFSTQGNEIESNYGLNYTPSTHKYSEEYFQNWYRSNANSESIRYSSLKEINKSNVRKLKVAFVFHSNVSGLNKANPIIAKNKAIIPLPNNELVAINASNGELLWRIKTDSQPALRGLTYWSNEKIDSRIFFTTRSYLYSISILDGKPTKEFGKNGKVFLENSNLPPIIFEDTIVCASTFSKKNPPAVKGFDLVTGKLKWKTNLMPNKNDGNNPGGNPWGGMSADIQRGIVYVVTGDPSPSAIGLRRPGDNLNSNSIVALDIRTGKLLWSFQEIKHDLWDKDISAPPIVTSIRKNGENIDVVIAVTKHGNTIILDRVKGKPIFPWTLRKAPSSSLPGEIAASYQPDIKIPEPFSKTEFKMTDVNTFDKNNLERLKSIVKNSNIGFFPTFDTKKSSIFFNTDGGAQWPGASIDPFEEVIYIASSEIAFKASVKDNYEECKSIINKIKCSIDYFSKNRYVGEIEAFKDSKGYPANKPPWGYLTAIKLTTGKIKWKIPLGRNLELEKEGIKVMGAKNIGAPVATAGGLVFCAGTFDNIFRAFDSSNGNVLWEYSLPAHGSAAPTIYQVNGKEYILLPATGYGANKNGQKEDSYIGFSL